MWYIASILKEHRARQGWTLRRLEFEINKTCGYNSISAQTLNQWEQGIYEPTSKVIDRIMPYLEQLEEVEYAPSTNTIETS